MVCKELFKWIDERRATSTQDVRYELNVSMLEIYNECVQDLLIHPNKWHKGGLQIRENKQDGIYVEGLSDIPVTSYEDIEEVIA